MSRIIHKKLGVSQAEHRYNTYVRYGRISRAWVGPLIVLGGTITRRSVIVILIPPV